MWRRLGLSFLVMAAGLGMCFGGMTWDFYGHEIARTFPDLESIYAAPHLVIFAGIGLTVLGFLLGALALRREGHTPLRMATS